MNRSRTVQLLAISLIGFGFQSSRAADQETACAKLDERFQATDALMEQITVNIADLKTIVTIDHSRLAADEGVTMPPSIVTIYSASQVNAALMKINPRVGLDLPHKILVFEQAGKPMVAFPTAAFLAKRHGIGDAGALRRYDSAMSVGLRGVERKFLSPVKVDGLTRDYGISELVSDFSLGESIVRLKDAVMNQGDTVWFGEVDLKSEVTAEGVQSSNATLLLFGGPKPGGLAMAKFPKLGLDAFCQKVLVYEDASGGVRVIFNDIVAMAKWHYGTSEKPHEVISQRLMQTFENALKERP